MHQNAVILNSDPWWSLFNGSTVYSSYKCHLLHSPFWQKHGKHMDLKFLWIEWQLVCIQIQNGYSTRLCGQQFLPCKKGKTSAIAETSVVIRY